MEFKTEIEKDKFIRLFNEKYNGLYECRIGDYKKTVSPSDMIYVMCQKHGLFIESAYDLLQGIGCFKCFEEKREQDIHKESKE